MPTYDFKCENCGSVQEIFRRFGEKTPETVADLDTICCVETAVVRQILYPPSAHIAGTTTVGRLAEENSKRLGQNRVSELTSEYQTRKDNVLKLKDGMSIQNKQKIGQEKMKQINKINNMTDSQKKNYIERGE